MSTLIRINFTNLGNGATTDPTFGLEVQGNNGDIPSTIGIQSTSIDDISGVPTGIGFENIVGLQGAGSGGNYSQGVGVFPVEVCNYYVWNNSDELSFRLFGFPPNTSVDVAILGGKGIDTTYDIDGNQNTYVASITSEPTAPITISTISDSNGDVIIDTVDMGGRNYTSGMEVTFVNQSVSSDDTVAFNDTLNYTTTGLGALTSATLTDSVGNTMQLTAVADTTAQVPDYGVGQRCLTGLVSLAVSDGIDSATTELALFPKTNYASVALESGFTKNQGDWTYGWDEVSYNPPAIGTEGHWSHPTIVYLGDGSVVGVTEATTVNSYVVDPSDGMMALQTIVFEGASSIECDIVESGPMFTESIDASVNVFIISASIIEQGPSFVESISASVPISINTKKIIRVR